MSPKNTLGLSGSHHLLCRPVIVRCVSSRARVCFSTRGSASRLPPCWCSHNVVSTRDRRVSRFKPNYLAWCDCASSGGFLVYCFSKSNPVTDLPHASLSVKCCRGTLGARLEWVESCTRRAFSMCGDVFHVSWPLSSLWGWIRIACRLQTDSKETRIDRAVTAHA